MLSPTVTSCGDNFLSKTGGYLGSAEAVTEREEDKTSFHFHLREEGKQHAEFLNLRHSSLAQGDRVTQPGNTTPFPQCISVAPTRGTMHKGSKGW